MAVDEFASQWQTIDQEWDQLHRDLDLWRARLTSCHRGSVHEALQGFAADFADVTETARELPRTTVTRELADMLIEVAEEEEAAFRQLRDRWQPDDISLFELVEQRRSDAARTQREVEYIMLELQEQFEAAADPEERAALVEFSDALDAVRDDWYVFHDDYAALRKDADHLDVGGTLVRLDELLAQFDAIAKAVSRLPAVVATDRMDAMLREAAEAESDALVVVHSRLLGALPPPPPGGSVPETPAHPTGAGFFLDGMDAIFRESEAVLEEVIRTTKGLIDDDPKESLAEVENFDDRYRRLLVEWDAFHQRYGDWRGADGGCDRTEVLQSLDRYNLRMGELGRDVRGLPQSSYLLPMHTLLIEAVGREEGAIRALRNSWRPFTVDAFKALEQERANAARLRRQADIGLQELRDRF